MIKKQVEPTLKNTKERRKKMSAIETKQNKANEHKPSLCKSWCANRNSSIRFGVLLVIIGLIWLGAKTGFLPVEWFHSELFWPSVVIFFGSWITLKNIIRKKYHNGSC
jgi:hypothetical protein